MAPRGLQEGPAGSSRGHQEVPLVATREVQGPPGGHQGTPGGASSGHKEAPPGASRGPGGHQGAPGCSTRGIKVNKLAADHFRSKRISMSILVSDTLPRPQTRLEPRQSFDL